MGAQVWDVRKLKQPLRVFEDLTTTHTNTMCGFSPDERLIMTAVCGESAEDEGGLVMFDRYPPTPPHPIASHFAVDSCVRYVQQRG